MHNLSNSDENNKKICIYAVENLNKFCLNIDQYIVASNENIYGNLLKSFSYVTIWFRKIDALFYDKQNKKLLFFIIDVYKTDLLDSH